MALLVATALLLAQISVFMAEGNNCREYRPANQAFCGNKPTISNNPAILEWVGSGVNAAVLDIRKVDNAWSQTGCFHLGGALSGSGRVPASSTHNISSVDYDSLYIARLLWVDSVGTRYYNRDNDCYFTIQPIPLPPQNVKAVYTTSSSITWTWDKPPNHSNKVTHYQGQVYNWGRATITTGTYYQRSGLPANTQYSFRVRAMTGSGSVGSWSTWNYHSTLPAAPLSPRVSIDVITARSVALTLSGCTDARVGTVTYIVKYHSDNGNGLSVTTGTSQLNVIDLRPGKQYTFQIQCENSVGLTGPSVTKYATTLNEDTLQPNISSVTISNSLTSATVFWTAPRAYTQVKVTGYDIRIVPHVNGIPQTLLATMRYCHGQSTNCSVSANLMPETVYTFQVLARTSVGASPWSMPVIKSALSLALELKISSVRISDSLDSTTITWTAPSPHPQVKVTGYNIWIVPHAKGIPQTPSATMRYCHGQGTHCTVSHGLMSETVYTFQVRAQTSVGTSPWSVPVVRSTLPAVPPRVDGFTASSPTSTSIALSWNQNNATIEYHRLILHNAKTNTTENYDLFHTVTSHIFHNLSPSTDYSVTITAVNNAGSGPLVFVTVITQGAPVSPLAVATGTLSTMVVIGIVAVPLAIVCIWWVGRKKWKDRAASDHASYNCELQDNAAYVEAAHNKLWSEASSEMEEEKAENEEEGCEEENMTANGESIALKPAFPKLPCRQYLQEKEVECRPIHLYRK